MWNIKYFFQITKQKYHQNFINASYDAIYSNLSKLIFCVLMKLLVHLGFFVGFVLLNLYFSMLYLVDHFLLYMSYFL